MPKEFTITHDGELDIATGRSRKELRWKNQQIAWSAFLTRISETHRTSETLAEYNLAKKPRQDEIKDVGGYNFGYLTGGRRKNGMVAHRQVLTLDMDFAPQDFWADLTLVEGFACAMYSTHKHAPTSPRLRLLIPLDRPVDASEYEAIARRIAGDIGIEYFDPTTFEPARLMYWPSTSSDGEYLFEYQDGEWLSADAVLSRYRDWKDISEWPFSKKVEGVVKRSMQKQGDPLEKPGIVGAFCRVYSVPEAIDAFLSEIYVPMDGQQGEGMSNRYTYVNGSTAGGVVVYEDKFAFSHHGTDPMSGKLCNAFDMVRLHLFGLRDEEMKGALPNDFGEGGLPTAKLPSYEAMCELAAKDRAVRIQIGVERIEAAGADFGGGAPTNLSGEALEVIGGEEADDMLTRKSKLRVAEDGEIESTDADETDGGDDEIDELDQEDGQTTEDMEWLADLAVDKKGTYLSTVDNVVKILQCDPKLKGKLTFCLLSKREVAAGHLPWRRVTKSTRNLVDRDESNLRHYLEHVYGITGEKKISDGLAVVLGKNSMHPVKDYLGRVGAEGFWDGVERVDELLIRYLGAEDNAYVRAVTRKTLVAAVARIYRPGIKYDTVLTLVGPQGIGKSQLIKRLGGEWYSDSFGGIGTKEAFESIQGVWLVEIAELAGLRKAEVDSIKHFISKQDDYYRVAYGKRTENFPRQCVFFATTNDEDFLKDQTGNRRWWPVQTLVESSCEVDTREVDVYDEEDEETYAVDQQLLKPKGDLFKELTKDVVAQIWAEVMRYWKKGESLIIDSRMQREVADIAKAAQDAHTEKHPWYGLVRDFLELPLCEDYFELDIYGRRAWLVEAQAMGLKLTSRMKPTEFVPVEYYGGREFGVFEHKGRKLLRRDIVTAYDLWFECLNGDVKSMTTQNTKILHMSMKSDYAVKNGWHNPKNGKIWHKGSAVRAYLRKQL
jgi:putative DNA primase/helicase